MDVSSFVQAGHSDAASLHRGTCLVLLEAVVRQSEHVILALYHLRRAIGGEVNPVEDHRDLQTKSNAAPAARGDDCRTAESDFLTTTGYRVKHTSTAIAGLDRSHDAEASREENGDEADEHRAKDVQHRTSDSIPHNNNNSSDDFIDSYLFRLFPSVEAAYEQIWQTPLYSLLSAIHFLACPCEPLMRLERVNLSEEVNASGAHENSVRHNRIEMRQVILSILIQTTSSLSSPTSSSPCLQSPAESPSTWRADAMTFLTHGILQRWRADSDEIPLRTLLIDALETQQASPQQPHIIRSVSENAFTNIHETSRLVEEAHDSKRHQRESKDIVDCILYGDGETQRASHSHPHQILNHSENVQVEFHQVPNTLLAVFPELGYNGFTRANSARDAFTNNGMADFSNVNVSELSGSARHRNDETLSLPPSPPASVASLRTHCFCPHEWFRETLPRWLLEASMQELAMVWCDTQHLRRCFARLRRRRGMRVLLRLASEADSGETVGRQNPESAAAASEPLGRCSPSPATPRSASAASHASKVEPSRNDTAIPAATNENNNNKTAIPTSLNVAMRSVGVDPIVVCRSRGESEDHMRGSTGEEDVENVDGVSSIRSAASGSVSARSSSRRALSPPPPLEVGTETCPTARAENGAAVSSDTMRDGASRTHNGSSSKDSVSGRKQTATHLESSPPAPTLDTVPRRQRNETRDSVAANARQQPQTASLLTLENALRGPVAGNESQQAEVSDEKTTSQKNPAEVSRSSSSGTDQPSHTPPLATRRLEFSGQEVPGQVAVTGAVRLANRSQPDFLGNTLQGEHDTEDDEKRDLQNRQREKEEEEKERLQLHEMENAALQFWHDHQRRQLLRAAFTRWRDERYYTSMAFRFVAALQRENGARAVLHVWRKKTQDRQKRRKRQIEDDLCERLVSARRERLRQELFQQWAARARVKGFRRRILGRRVLRHWRCVFLVQEMVRRKDAQTAARNAGDEMGPMKPHTSLSEHSSLMVVEKVSRRLGGVTTTRGDGAASVLQHSFARLDFLRLAPQVLAKWRQRLLERQAEAHYNKLCLMQCFRQWQHAFRIHRANSAADALHFQKLSTKVWTRWVERARTEPLLRAYRDTHHSILISDSAAIAEVTINSPPSKHSRALIILDELSNLAAAPTTQRAYPAVVRSAFKKWRAKTEKISKMKVTADEHGRPQQQAVLRSCLDRWRTRLSESQRVDAFKHRKEQTQTLHQMWRKWRDRTSRRLQARAQADDLAANFIYPVALQKRCLRVWSGRTQKRQERRAQMRTVEFNKKADALRWVNMAAQTFYRWRARAHLKRVYGVDPQRRRVMLPAELSAAQTLCAPPPPPTAVPPTKLKPRQNGVTRRPTLDTATGRSTKRIVGEMVVAVPSTGESSKFKAQRTLMALETSREHTGVSQASEVHERRAAQIGRVWKQLGFSAAIPRPRQSIVNSLWPQHTDALSSRAVNVIPCGKHSSELDVPSSTRHIYKNGKRVFGRCNTEHFGEYDHLREAECSGEVNFYDIIGNARDMPNRSIEPIDYSSPGQSMAATGASFLQPRAERVREGEATFSNQTSRSASSSASSQSLRQHRQREKRRRQREQDREQPPQQQQRFCDPASQHMNTSPPPFTRTTAAAASAQQLLQQQQQHPYHHERYDFSPPDVDTIAAAVIAQRRPRDTPAVREKLLRMVENSHAASQPRSKPTTPPAAPISVSSITPLSIQAATMEVSVSNASAAAEVKSTSTNQRIAAPWMQIDENRRQEDRVLRRRGRGQVAVSLFGKPAGK